MEQVGQAQQRLGQERTVITLVSGLTAQTPNSTTHSLMSLPHSNIEQGHLIPTEQLPGITQKYQSHRQDQTRKTRL